MHHSHEALGDLARYFALAHQDAHKAATGSPSPSCGARDSQKLRMTAEFLQVLLRQVNEFAETCHEYDDGIFWQDLHDLVACVEVGADMLEVLNSTNWSANEPVPASILLDLGRRLRDRRFQLSDRDIVEDIVLNAFDAAANVATAEKVADAIRDHNSHQAERRTPQPRLCVARSDDPTSVIGRVQHLAAEGDLLLLVRSWFDAIVDDEREAINGAGFTLEEVYSVTQNGNLGHPTKCITIGMCCSQRSAPNEVTGTGALASFQKKALRLTRVQRAGVALALHELVRSRKADDRTAILVMFRAHGIHLQTGD